MKSGQIALIGMMACLLGCGGMGAYVPDNVPTTNNPVQCAALSLSHSSTFSVEQGGQSTEVISVINGQVSSLQSRAPGEATVTLSISGLPNFVTGSFSPNPVTVQLDSLENVDLNFDATQANAGSAYVLTITATQQGCTPVTSNVSLNVFQGGE